MKRIQLPLQGSTSGAPPPRYQPEPSAGFSPHVLYSVNPIRIVHADDDADDRMFFENLLHAASIPNILNVVEDGEQLMKLLSDADDFTLPHFIFLDINMPRMGGLECLNEIRKNKKFDHIVIFILSTSGNRSDIDLSFRLGGNGYLLKDDFLRVDKNHFEKIFSLPVEKHLEKTSKEKFVLPNELLTAGKAYR